MGRWMDRQKDKSDFIGGCASNIKHPIYSEQLIIYILF